MCSDHDLDPYLKGQGHTRQSIHARVRAITCVHIDGLPSNLEQMSLLR